MISRFTNNDDTVDGKTSNIGYGRGSVSKTMISKVLLQHKELPASSIAGSLPSYSFDPAGVKSNTVYTDLTYVPQQSLLRSTLNSPDFPSHHVTEREFPKYHIQTTKVVTTPTFNDTQRNPIDGITTGVKTEFESPEIHEKQRPVQINTQDIANRVYYLMRRDLIIESERTRRSER
jgi:hypothetical protein